MSEGAARSEPVFFIDRALGSRRVAQALSDAGARVEVHDDHFPKDTPDEDWLPEVAARGWIVVTKDQRIAYRNLEKLAVAQSGARLFVLVNRNLSAASMSAALVAALPRMARFADDEVAPFIAKVFQDGRVQAWRTAEDLAEP